MYCFVIESILFFLVQYTKGSLQMKKQIIDFVITWVDGSDPLWFRQKQNAKKKQGVSVDIDDRIERYRDWEILKYLFRSIENFAPWVNNVYFVT